MNKTIIIYEKTGQNLKILNSFNKDNIIITSFNDILYKNISLDKLLYESNDGIYMVIGFITIVDDVKYLYEILLNIEVFNLDDTLKQLSKEYGRE